jgi:MFS family permease
VVPITAITWAPLQFERLFNISTVDASRIVSVFGVLTVISSILGGVATKNLGRGLVMTLSMGGVLVGILLLTNPANPTIGLLIMALLGFASMFYISANFSMVPESAPAGTNNPGFAFGVFNTISNALAFFPPLVTAYILDRTNNFTFLYLAVSVMAVIGLLSAILLRTRRE